MRMTAPIEAGRPDSGAKDSDHYQNGGTSCGDHYEGPGMALEDTLDGWTGPSSDTEQDKQDRTERMIREAVAEHGAFDACELSIYAKGSYANNTNVRAD